MALRVSQTDPTPFHPVPPASGRGQIDRVGVQQVEALMERFGEPAAPDQAALIIAILSAAAGAYSAWAFAKWGSSWQSGQRLDDARKIAGGAEAATLENIRQARIARRSRVREGF